MDDVRSKNTSKQENPIKKRLTASEERLTDLHRQWEGGTKFHVVIRVRPMTVREIKECAKVCKTNLYHCHKLLRIKCFSRLFLHLNDFQFIILGRDIC